MNVAELITMTRTVALDDLVLPYLWGDEELCFALTRSFNELVKPSLIVDQTTAAVVQIKLLSNLGVYALDSRILQVKDARLSTNASYGSLGRTTEEHLNQTIANWRASTGTPIKYVPGAYSGYLSVYPKFDATGEVVGSANISFATNTITKAGEDFSAHYAIGDSFNVSGTTLNNGYLTVATVGTTTMTTVESLVTENNQSATLRKVCDTLLMTVNRLPSARFTAADITAETEITGIRADHQDGLVDGIAKWAFLKPDSNCLDLQSAERHRMAFEEFKAQIKRDIILLNKPDKSRKPRSGTSIWY